MGSPFKGGGGAGAQKLKVDFTAKTTVSSLRVADGLGRRTVLKVW
jgi:hypothetical protein